MELLALGILIGVLLCGATYALWPRANYRPPAAGSPVLQGFASGVAMPHVHEASTAGTNGWRCDCGLHYHNYIFVIEDSDERRCQCGATGIGKAWA